MSKDKKVKKQENLDDEKSREIAIRRENPFSLFENMDRHFQELEKSFDDYFWGSSKTIIPKRSELFYRTPLTNISEDEKCYKVVAEVPGLDKKEIDISFRNGLLEIKGESKEESKEEDKEGKIVRREYKSSSYYRAFTLPENADEKGIVASLDKGILTVTLPKKAIEPKEKRKIEIV